MGIAGHHKVSARFSIAQKNRVCDRANASRVARQRLPVHRTHPGSTVACGQSRLTADQKELWQAVEAGLPAKLEGSVGDQAACVRRGVAVCTASWKLETSRASIGSSSRGRMRASLWLWLRLWPPLQASSSCSSSCSSGSTSTVFVTGKSCGQKLWSMVAVCQVLLPLCCVRVL